MEDYAANRKSGATAAVGATQPAGGLFGGAAQQTPVSQPGGLFGSQPKPAGFGKKAIHSLLIHSNTGMRFSGIFPTSEVILVEIPDLVYIYWEGGYQIKSMTGSSVGKYNLIIV